MPPGFRVFQTQPQGNAREISLQNDQTILFNTIMSNPWPEVNLTRRNNRLLVAFYETGITLNISVHERQYEYNINFEVKVPQIFQQNTRGFLGNLDDNSTNEFYIRSETNLIPQPENIINRLSEAQLFDIFQSCKFHSLINNLLIVKTVVQ